MLRKQNIINVNPLPEGKKLVKRPNSSAAKIGAGNNLLKRKSTR